MYMVHHTFFCLLLEKNGKSIRAWPILKSNYTTFWYKKKFLGWIIIFFRKDGPRGPAPIFYEVSIVLIDFIAILLSPGIFLIQIVNTNMYLIYFYSKNNVKICFPKSWVLLFQNCFRHSLSIGTRWNILHWHQQRLHNNDTEPNLKKN